MVTSRTPTLYNQTLMPQGGAQNKNDMKKILLVAMIVTLLTACSENANYLWVNGSWLMHIVLGECVRISNSDDRIDFAMCSY